jgi:uncharacterized protein YbaA (DUF1428 family)
LGGSIPRQKLAVYRRMARIARKVGKIRRKHGAPDDVMLGKFTPFPQAITLKNGDVVVFSWIAYASRNSRDRINKLEMAGPASPPWWIRSRCRSTASRCFGRLQDARRVVVRASSRC